MLLAKLAGAMKGNLSKAAALFQAPLSQAARLAAPCRTSRAKRRSRPTAPQDVAASAADDQALLHTT